MRAMVFRPLMGRMGRFRYELDGDRYVQTRIPGGGRDADRALSFYHDTTPPVQRALMYLAKT